MLSDLLQDLIVHVNVKSGFGLLYVDDLRDCFEKFGKISAATVKTDPMTGRSKGFGFVMFVDPSSVDQVMMGSMYTAYIVGGVRNSPVHKKFGIFCTLLHRIYVQGAFK